MSLPAQVCTRCVMDTSDPGISFDSSGVCSHCRTADEVLPYYMPPEGVSETRLAALTHRIRRMGSGHDYDSIIGLSGGVDSSFAVHLACQMGLRPLAVHFDNGWNAELAVENIQRIVEANGLDLVTYVVNWAEFRDLQRAFLKASVVDIEIVTDHAIVAALVGLATEHKIRFVISGTNKATEHGMPEAWVWNQHDWTNIEAIHQRFGTVPLRTFPHIQYRKWFAIRAFRRGLEYVEPLNLIRYRRDEAAATLAKTYGWRDYGGKHHESIFTRFYQSYILPTKFGIDKRKSHLSARIRNGEIDRPAAVKALESPLYSAEELANERTYVLKKLGFDDAEFKEILAAPPRPHDSYPSDVALTRRLRMLYRATHGIRMRVANARRAESKPTHL